MAIVLETSPALVSTTFGAELTTDTFTAPAESIVVACAMIGVLPEITNNGAALTWTQRKAADDDTDSIWTAPVASQRAGLTVTCEADGGGSFIGALSVYVFTGTDLGNPVGATGDGASTETSATVTGYSSTVAGSRGLAIARDVDADGTPTSSDDERAWTGSLNSAGMSIIKAANTATAATNVTFNLDAFSTLDADWSWIAVELVPPAPPQPSRVWTPRAAVHRASSW